MRIISKFHDYYDGVLKYFTDDTPLYLRNTDEINISQRIDRHRWEKFNKPNPLTDKIGMFISTRLSSESLELEHNKNYCLSQEGVVGFCGQIFPYLQLQIREKTNHYYYAPHVVTQYIYDENAFCDYRQNWYGHFFTQKPYTQKEMYNSIVNDRWVQSLFFQFKVPIFILHNYTKLVINPCLKDIGFQKNINPYNAMQELNMFLTNQLVEPSTLPISITDDKVLQYSKGFDSKYSFRKEPSK